MRDISVTSVNCDKHFESIMLRRLSGLLIADDTRDHTGVHTQRAKKGYCAMKTALI